MLSNNWLISFARLWNRRLTEWICWRFLLFNFVGKWVNRFNFFRFLSKWIYCFLLRFFYLLFSKWVHSFLILLNFLCERIYWFLFLGKWIDRLFLRLFLLCKWIHWFCFFLFSKRIYWSLFLFLGEWIDRCNLFWFLLLLFILLFGKWIECILLLLNGFLRWFFQKFFFMVLVRARVAFSMATFTLLISMNSIDYFVQLFFRNSK